MLTVNSVINCLKIATILSIILNFCKDNAAGHHQRPREFKPDFGLNVLVKMEFLSAMRKVMQIAGICNIYAIAGICKVCCHGNA